MKTAAAVLAILGTAGGLGMALPGASAPLRVGYIAFQDAAQNDRIDRVSTYAAQEPMTAAAVASWSQGFSTGQAGRHMVLIYAPGEPVPDPAAATTFADALWLAETDAVRWRVDISAEGTRQISRFDDASQDWQIAQTLPRSGATSDPKIWQLLSDG